MNNKVTYLILLVFIIVFTACNSKNKTRESIQIFDKILNTEQILTSDTIIILDEFGTIPQELYTTISFTVSDSSIFINNRNYLYFPFKRGDYKNEKCYIRFQNDTLSIFDLKKEYILLICNAKKGSHWLTGNNNFLPEFEISKQEKFWNKEIQDTIFVFSVKEVIYVNDVLHLTSIYFSKKYAFLKFIYTYNNLTIESSNRKMLSK